MKSITRIFLNPDTLITENLSMIARKLPRLQVLLLCNGDDPGQARESNTTGCPQSDWSEQCVNDNLEYLDSDSSMRMFRDRAGTRTLRELDYGSRYKVFYRLKIESERVCYPTVLYS